MRLARADRAMIAGVAAYRRHPFMREMADPPAICPLSIGGCWIDPDAEWNDWYARADAALYRAKRAGGDRIAWHAAGDA